MNLETKFGPDQQVWAISNANYGQHIAECTICGRTGKVRINGEELTCPKCGGQSVVPEWSIEKRRVTVVQVEAVRTISRLARPEGWDNRNTYRLEHIGDGRIWPEDHLFSNEQEAQFECNKRNRLER